MFIVGVGATSVVTYVKLRDSATGFAKTGLLFNSAGAFASYVRPKAAAVVIALVTQTVAGAYSSGGFVEIDAANAPGLYRLDVPNGAFAIGADYSLISIGFSGVLSETVECLLDPMPDVRKGSVVADAGNTALTFKTDLAMAADNFAKDLWVLFRTGALADQAKQIVGSVAASGFVSVAGGFTAAPGNTDAFVIVNR